MFELSMKNILFFFISFFKACLSQISLTSNVLKERALPLETVKSIFIIFNLMPNLSCVKNDYTLIKIIGSMLL